MGKKKFIDKKKSVTFQLLARDSSEPCYSEEPENDRVFVRIDNNPVSIRGLDEGCYIDGDDSSNYGGGRLPDDPNSIFADALGDDDDDDHEHYGVGFPGQLSAGRATGKLPDHVRKGILELGFPDDGYNYLTHLREIRYSGGGSSYYQNPKANYDQLPLDVKAYDASRVKINEANVETNEKMLYSVAEKTVHVRVQKAMDPEVLALLNDNESCVGSDNDVLEEDFVVKANLPGEGEEEVEVVDLNVMDKHAEKPTDPPDFHGSHEFSVRGGNMHREDDHNAEKPRSHRLLDEQFDALELQEYGTDSDDDYHAIATEDEEYLAEKLNNTLKDQNIDDLGLDDKYKAPAEIMKSQGRQEDEEIVHCAADVLRRCAEYAEGYENADQDDQEVVIMEESSDESEAWDCETIVSTYSNLDNHPGRIGPPQTNRKKKLIETLSEVMSSSNKNVIALHGKEMLPVDYLPHGRRATKEKVKPEPKPDLPKRKPHGQESKDEKKQRKAAIKDERREARRMKKEMKELYRSETNRAQKVVAISGPSSIHLM